MAAAPARSGLLRCMGSVPLWLSAARLESSSGNVPKARALLEQARLKNPKHEVGRSTVGAGAHGCSGVGWGLIRQRIHC